MTALDRLAARPGRYAGEYRLWLDPEAAPEVSRTTLTLSSELGGRFVRLAYTWTAQGEPAEGAFLLGFDPEGGGSYTCAWVDTFHMSRRIMFCEGRTSEDGAIRVVGRYAGEPGGPDWGWRTEIEPTAAGLRVRAFNIAPDGSEARAVEADYSPA